MTFSDSEYLDRFESILEEGLLKLSSNLGLTDGEMLSSEDINAKWEDSLMQGYVGDAVENFNAFPEVAVAWAAYLGMAVAFDWDANIERLAVRRYSDYYGPRGYDDMDEHIVSYIGAEDPCRISDKTLGKAVDALKAVGYKDVTLKVYPGMRHEIHNETGRREVWDDILSYVEGAGR